MNNSICSRRRIVLAVKISTVFIVIAATLQTAAAQYTAPGDPYVHRPNFVVADIDRALSVYGEILGFKVDAIAPVASTSFMYEVFGIKRQAKLRIAFLSSVAGEFGNLGLTEVKGVDLPAPQDNYSNVLIIETNREIQPLYDALKVAGCDMGNIVELTAPARTEVPFTDLDGHRIILMKLRRDKK